MTIYAAAGAAIEATLEGAPTGLVGSIGIRILDTPGTTTVLARSTSEITEVPSGSGLYHWAGTAPSNAGAYTVVWDEPATLLVASEDLVVGAGGTPTGADLCTLDDVRVVLQSQGSDTGQDDEITRLIPAASQAIMRRCEREFAPAVDGATRTVEHYGGRRITPYPYDLRAVTSMVFDPTTTNPVTLVADNDYSVSPLDRDGVVRWIDLAHYTYQWRGYTCPRYLQITGNWGYPSVPVDVAQAAAVTVASWLDRSTSDYAGLAEGGGIDTTPSTGANYGIPAGAYRLLLPYIRLAVA